jgi:hypothetical protein
MAWLDGWMGGMNEDDVVIVTVMRGMMTTLKVS